MTNNTVAKTILEQLGGNQFRSMTGARDFVSSDKSLWMKLGSGAKCDGKTVTHFRVDLEANDTYTLRFSFLRGTTTKELKVVTDVYAEDLRCFFEQNTGMRTSLTQVFA